MARLNEATTEPKVIKNVPSPDERRKLQICLSSDIKFHLAMIFLSLFTKNEKSSLLLTPWLVELDDFSGEYEWSFITRFYLLRKEFR